MHQGKKPSKGSNQRMCQSVQQDMVWFCFFLRQTYNLFCLLGGLTEEQLC